MIWDIRPLYKKPRWNGSEQLTGLVELLLSPFPPIGKKGKENFFNASSRLERRKGKRSSGDGSRK